MIKLIADSSAGHFTARDTVCFESVPMTIQAGDRCFVDDESLDTHELLDFLAAHKGKSGTACPGPAAWMNAFEGFDEIFVVTITSSLSGTYSSALAARDIYLQSHPEAKIHVFDSLSTGPEMRLLLEKLEELASDGLSFEAIRDAGKAYLSETKLIFSLQSLHNLAQNGRVSVLVAGAIGLLGIRILAKASDEGTIEPIEKCRGDKRTHTATVQQMLENGYHGGKVRISHADNPAAALRLQVALHEQFPTADITISSCRGLCSYYAERGGIIIGYET